MTVVKDVIAPSAAALRALPTSCSTRGGISSGRMSVLEIAGATMKLACTTNHGCEKRCRCAAAPAAGAPRGAGGSKCSEAGDES